MAGFDYERPTSLSEATALLKQWGDQAHPLAGGTDLAVGIRHQTHHPGIVVDVKGIPELGPSIEQTEGTYIISANTVMTDLEKHEGINQVFRGLVEAAEVVGSVQIRNRATLVGNLCNASPAADTPPMLVALDASVRISGSDGSREMKVDDFLVDYRQTALRAGELLSAVVIPEPGPRTGTSFLKLGVRRAMEISIVCVGARVTLDEDGTIASAGIGLGSVAPKTIRPAAAEDLLAGEMASHDLFAAAGASAQDGCSPIDDLRASGEYRRAMVPVLVRRALSIASDRAKAAR